MELSDTIWKIKFVFGQPGTLLEENINKTIDDLSETYGFPSKIKIQPFDIDKNNNCLATLYYSPLIIDMDKEANNSDTEEAEEIDWRIGGCSECKKNNLEINPKTGFCQRCTAINE